MSWQGCLATGGQSPVSLPTCSSQQSRRCYTGRPASSYRCYLGQRTTVMCRNILGALQRWWRPWVLTPAGWYSAYPSGHSQVLWSRWEPAGEAGFRGKQRHLPGRTVQRGLPPAHRCTCTSSSRYSLKQECVKP